MVCMLVSDKSVLLNDTAGMSEWFSMFSERLNMRVMRPCKLCKWVCKPGLWFNIACLPLYIAGMTFYILWKGLCIPGLTLCIARLPLYILWKGLCIPGLTLCKPVFSFNMRVMCPCKPGLWFNIASLTVCIVSLTLYMAWKGPCIMGLTSCMLCLAPNKCVLWLNTLCKGLYTAC